MIDKILFYLYVEILEINKNDCEEMYLLILDMFIIYCYVRNYIVK